MKCVIKCKRKWIDNEEQENMNSELIKEVGDKMKKKINKKGRTYK